MGVPSRSCNPRERNWEPLPIPPMSRSPPRAPRFSPAPAALPSRSQPQWRPPRAQLRPNPHPQPSKSRPAQPRFTPRRVRSQRVSSLSGHHREHNWEALPHPRQEPNPAPRHPGSPRPCRTPSAFPAAVGTPESTTVTTPHPLPTGTPTRAAWDRPAPGALPAHCPLPPGAPGEPCPHARFQERLSDLATAARSNTRTIHPPHRDNPSCLP